MQQLHKYKTLILRVGFDESKHGFLNPCNDIINEIFERKYKGRNSYRPVPFYPSEPSDKNAHLCNIILKNDYMFTEDNKESFEDNMIVEFRYDNTKKNRMEMDPHSCKT